MSSTSSLLPVGREASKCYGSLGEYFIRRCRLLGPRLFTLLSFMFNVCTNLRSSDTESNPKSSRKRKRSIAKTEIDHENELPASPNPHSRRKKDKNGKPTRRARQNRSSTPGPLKHDESDVYYTLTKSSKYWELKFSPDENDFPFHLIDTTRLSYYLLMLCPPKLIQGEIVILPCPYSYSQNMQKRLLTILLS
jgi:hypothetical protein